MPKKKLKRKTAPTASSQDKAESGHDAKKSKMKKSKSKAKASHDGDGDDARFSRFAQDPKFLSVPRHHRQLNIDDRFGAVLSKDARFATQGSVDKRGRPAINRGQGGAKDDLKRFYQLKDSDESDTDDEEEEEDEEQSKAVKAKLRDMSVDYARGEGRLLSSSSSDDDDDSSDDEDSEDESAAAAADAEAAEQFDKWGELDHDADRGEHTEATRRIAVCNMDWDRVGAQDLFLAMGSFCPQGAGQVQKVSVYVSEFGKKRLEEEDRLGPEELRGKRRSRGEDNNDSGESSEEDEPADEKQAELLEKQAMEKVRRYQVNRLRYYYAVAEFDSAATAGRVYDECDGTEYELSATRFDLRFIPDDMSFEDNDAPTEVCTAPPDPQQYKPKSFFTTALQQGKVELTWDETDPERLAAMRRAFEKVGDENDDGIGEVKDYLASSSGDEQERGSDDEAVADDDGEEDDDKDAIAKYRALLADIQGQQDSKMVVEEDDDSDEESGNREVVFKADDSVKRDMEKKAVEKMTPWEQYLHKKKVKAEAKREKRRLANQKRDDDDGGNRQAFSDDELPEGVDFNDPFFADEHGMEDEEGKGAKKKKKKEEKKKKRKAGAGLDEEKEGADLNLLVMDSDDDRRHFDYKEIVAQEGKKKKKKRRELEKEKAKQQAKDTFSLDLQDNRFQAVFDHADFNVDPSNPNFKKTKNMQEIIEEKQRRILESDKKEMRLQKQPGAGAKKAKGQQSERVTAAPAPKASNLDRLVNSVKAKTKQSVAGETRKPRQDVRPKKKKRKMS